MTWYAKVGEIPLESTAHGGWERWFGVGKSYRIIMKWKHIKWIQIDLWPMVTYGDLECQDRLCQTWQRTWLRCLIVMECHGWSYNSHNWFQDVLSRLVVLNSNQLLFIRFSHTYRWLCKISRSHISTKWYWLYRFYTCFIDDIFLTVRANLQESNPH